LGKQGRRGRPTVYSQLLIRLERWTGQDLRRWLEKKEEAKEGKPEI